MTAADASPKDIELVMTFATCSRSRAVAALEANNFGRTQEDIGTAIMHLMTAALISPKDIELVMTLATCSRSTAVAALEANNFGRTKEDIVNAIMHIMEHDSSWRQSKDIESVGLCSHIRGQGR